jgi:hypothetical protein
VAARPAGRLRHLGPGSHPLAEHWNGSAWTIRAISTLNAISCVSATSCTAVGYHELGAPNAYGAAWAVYWNGSTWQPQHPAQPNTDQQLAAISCITAVTCTVVGNNTSGPEPLAEHR